MTLRSALYSASTLTAAAVLPPFLLASARGRRHLLQRYGFWDNPAIARSPTFWFHGASLGEINSLLPLIDSVDRKIKAVHQILVSATSVTGLERAKSGNHVRRILPFDHPLFFRPALGGIDLRAFIFGETELWPNLLGYLEQRGVPAALVNARISSKSFSRYQFLGAFLRTRLRALRVICCQTEVAHQRFVALGADASRVHVIGNAKFDVCASLDKAAAQELRAGLFTNSGEIVVLGSLRPGEEEFWFGAIAKLQRESSSLKFVVAPRHTEKFDFFAKRLKDYQIEYVRKSKLETQSSASVILLDSLGQLEQIYSIATLAFVGGTLVPIGGHSPVEAAAYGVAMAAGSWRANIEEVMSELDGAGAVIKLESVQDVEATLRDVQMNPQRFEKAGAAAKSVWQKNRGATQRTLSILEESGVL